MGWNKVFLGGKGEELHCSASGFRPKSWRQGLEIRPWGIQTVKKKGFYSQHDTGMAGSVADIGIAGFVVQELVDLLFL